jgi:hypothetical protein
MRRQTYVVLAHPSLTRWEAKHHAYDSALARGSNVLNSSLLGEEAD